MIDFSEFNLFTIKQKLKNKKSYLDISFNLINLLEVESLKKFFYENKIDYIFHAAAYKHVDMLNHNIIQAVKNNIVSTKNLVDICNNFKINNFVYVSTDKAVRPINVMGFTKRISEIIVQSATVSNKYTNFSIVRFGNVLGSKGSVVQIFEDQVMQGGPVTVTHPEVNRYFMTIKEAVGLMLQSCLFSKRDIAEVFVLDMGKPILIKKLAELIIKLMGKNIKTREYPNGDILIDFIGLFEGEKISEELLIGNNPIKTEHEDIFKANENFPAQKEYNLLIDKILKSIDSLDLEKIQIIRKEYNNILI